MEGSEESPPLSENGGDKMTRTSSQTSGASTNSKKTYPARRTPKTLSHSSSVSSLKRDPSLTSFPSLSPEHAGNQQDVSNLPSPPQPSRTTSQKVRDRKKTLASLTSASGSFRGKSSLFDDSPQSSLDIPGALHLASDEHVERLIARSGALKLVKQFAQDLALRDAELSSLRSRADDRERELKKMLREAEVSSANIERRLHSLENASSQQAAGAESRPAVSRNITTRIDVMMHQAMAEEVGLENDNPAAATPVDPSATVRPIKSGELAMRKPSTESSRSRNRGQSTSGWQFWGANATSPSPSKASSVLEGDGGEANATTKSRAPSSSIKRRGLDSILQASTQQSSYFIGGANRTVKKPVGDDASFHSQRSNKSMGWTKIFAGTSLAVKEDEGRPRSSSLEQDKSGKSKISAAAAESAMLSKVRTNPPKPSSSSKPQALASGNTLKAKPTGRRTPTMGPASAAEHVRRDSDATSLGPVEMDTILDAAAKPPTMTHAYNNYQSEGLLTDRFGFIYDQRQRKRQRQALAANKANRLSGMSGMESLSSFRTESDSADESNHAKPNGTLVPPKRPETPASMEEESQPKKWSDFLKVPVKLSSTRPTELLSHTPSAGAVVTVSTADASGIITPPKARETSISVKSQLALPITSFVPKPSQSTITADSPTFANNQNHVVTNAPDQEPVKMLLEQLTELHDTLQAEREAKFNDFLRKVRAERSTTAPSDRTLNNTPEADIPYGELIGNLGHSKNRTKYAQFRALVLGGIPVSLRPRVWAECSGASSQRVPGYYEELLTRTEDEMDPEIAQQIAADIPRTLSDNVFFRNNGAGTGKLSEILRAYSLHNHTVGYCQGMNLITANLLLICATSEDVFWLLSAIVDKIMPSGYFDRGLRVSRADQAVLRSYVSEVLPNLDMKLEDLGVELEACTFQWFLSLYSAVVSAEPLFRIWDVVLCLNSSESQPQEATVGVAEGGPLTASSTTAVEGNGAEEWHDGTCSPFLFQLSLALLKLNETSLLVCCLDVYYVCKMLTRWVPGSAKSGTGLSVCESQHVSDIRQAQSET